MKKLLIIFLAFSFMLTAAPNGETVIFGNADFKNIDSSHLQILTNNNTLIHWDDFSIKPGELVEFLQANPNHAVINKVLGTAPSQIFGHLKSNGHIYLINPKGIYIGEKALIETASFFASALDLVEGDPLKNETLLFQGSNGSIVNYGTIKATNGHAILIGLRTENHGTIESSKDICLASGKELIIKPLNDEKIFIKASYEKLEDEGLINTGSLKAENIEMKADGSLYALAIQHKGTINATSKEIIQGRVFLKAEKGKIETSGQIYAKTQEDGGQIQILAEEINIAEGSTIDASGETGGTILIGGDYQGSNPYILNSEKVHIEKDSIIRANATINDAGKVIVWSNESTHYFGNIEAKSDGIGSGGFVEISTKNTDYIFEGKVSTTGLSEQSGTLLLDPCDITISRATSSPAFTNPYIPNTDTATLKVSDITRALSSNDVIIDANGAGAGTGNITLNSKLSWSANNTLTIRAPGTLTLNSSLKFTGSDSNTNRIILEVENLVIDALSAGHAVTITSDASVKIDGSGDILIRGGSGRNYWGRIKTTGNYAEIRIGEDTPYTNIYLYGGTSSYADAKIISDGTSAHINVNATDLIYLESGTGGAAYAEFTTQSSSSNVNIGQTTAPTNIEFYARNVSSKIQHDRSGDTRVTCADTLWIHGSETSSSGSAFFTTSGATTVNTPNLIIGGANSLGGSAISTTGTMTINILNNGNLNIIGGKGIGRLTSSSGSIYINNPTTFSLDAYQNRSQIEARYAISIDNAGSFTMDASHTPSHNSTSYCLISSTSTNDITISANGEMNLIAGSSISPGTGYVRIINSSGDISITNSTGDINLTAGSGSGENECYIRANSGDILITNSNGDINLTGGASNGAAFADIRSYNGELSITNSNGNINLTAGSGTDESFASILTYDNNPITINNPNGSINMTGGSNTAGIGRAYIATLEGGNLDIICQGGTITGGSNDGSNYAGYVSALNSGTGSISIESSDTLTFQAGTDNANHAEIITVNDGDITLTGSGGLILKGEGDAGSVGRILTNGTGFIHIGTSLSSIGLISMTGSTLIQASEDVAIYSESLSMTTTALVADTAEIRANDNLIIEVNSDGFLNLDASDSTNGNTTIASTTGTISMTTGQYLKLESGTGVNSYAVIQTETADKSITINSAVAPLGYLSIISGSDTAFAAIRTLNGGDITAYFAGNCVIDAGMADAYIIAGYNSGGGNISIYNNIGGGPDKSFTISGGSTEDLIDTGIFTDNGNIIIQNIGPLTMTGSTSNQGDTFIATDTGDITLTTKGISITGGGESSFTGIETGYEGVGGGNITITNTSSPISITGGIETNAVSRIYSEDGFTTITSSGQNFSLIGGSASGTYAQIYTVSQPLNITANDLTIQGNIAGASIETTSADLTLDLTGALTLTGGNGTNAYANIIIHTSGSLITSPTSLSLTAGDGSGSIASIQLDDDGFSETFSSNLTLTGSTAASAYLSVNGVVDLSATNIILTSESSSFPAYIDNSGTEDITLTTTNNLSLTSSYIQNDIGAITINSSNNIDLDSSSYIKNLGNEGLSITAGGDINLSNSYIQNSNNQILLIADKNISLTSSSYIQNTGSGTTLVIDNENPIAPATGANSFTLDSSSYITTSGDLRIYTSEFPYNIIKGTLNGTAFTGALNTQDANNIYDIYYSGGTYNSPYTVYYKSASNFVAENPEQITPTMEGFHSLDNYINNAYYALIWNKRFYIQFSKKQPVSEKVLFYKPILTTLLPNNYIVPFSLQYINYHSSSPTHPQ